VDSFSDSDLICTVELPHGKLDGTPVNQAGDVRWPFELVCEVCIVVGEMLRLSNVFGMLLYNGVLIYL